MKNILIIAAVAAAMAGVAALKLRESSSDTASSCCPCTLAKQSVTNETDKAASDVE